MNRRKRFIQIKMMCFCIFFISVLITSGYCHGDIHLSITRVTKEIKNHPDSANLYYTRAQFYQTDQDFDRSMADYLHAIQLDPTIIHVNFELAKLCLQHGYVSTAMIYINTFLDVHPNHGKARFTKSLIFSALENNHEALNEIKNGINNIPDPEPEHFLMASNTELLLDSTRIEEALSWLREGERILGKNIVMAQNYIQLCKTYKKWDLALMKVKEIMTYFPRKEKWLFEKGHIFELSGKFEESKEMYIDCINTIHELPTKFRKTPAMLYLLSEAISGRDRVAKMSTIKNN
jgi:tetratricopeptide (TPR) repeat protein